MYMAEPIISFKNVNFKYHSQAEPTLHSININIYPGEKVLVVGASGSGKSTFINCINGLIPNKYEGELTGKIEIKSKNTNDYTFHERSNVVGTVLQDTDGQFVGLTAAEDMAFILENNNISNREMKDSVNHWAKIVGIQQHLSKRPQDLSGGQKQRVSLGGILIHQTPILLFDEPLANLDPKTGQETIHLLEEIHHKTNSTILMVEHRLEEALNQTFDRVILFNEGKIIADTTPDHLLKTNQLLEAGIREPLYVTVMKYANVPLKNLDNISNKEKILEFKTVQNSILSWFNHIKIREIENSNNETLLSLSNITYQYNKRGVKVLNNVNLDINNKEMISIVGHNGAGKSTLAKAICGFLKTKGKMYWEDKRFDKLSISERSSYVGYVMQNPNHMICEKMIYDEVALGLRLRNIDEEKIKEKVHSVLKICGLYSFRNWPIAALSYGQKKRVTIASILVLDPKVIILDEPTAGQDFYHYTEMMEFLSKLNQQGKTIIMITHDMHLLVEYTERTIVVSEGQIIADSTPIDVLLNNELCMQASLHTTSLYDVARKLDIQKPQEFVKKFIEYDKEVR